MDRPIETIQLPNGTEVKLYTYLTNNEKQAIAKEVVITGNDKNTATVAILREAILNKLLVEPIPGFGDMESITGDVLYAYAERVYIGKNSQGDSKQ